MLAVLLTQTLALLIQGRTKHCGGTKKQSLTCGLGAEATGQAVVCRNIPISRGDSAALLARTTAEGALAPALLSGHACSKVLYHGTPSLVEN